MFWLSGLDVGLEVPSEQVGILITAPTNFLIFFQHFLIVLILLSFLQYYQHCFSIICTVAELLAWFLNYWHCFQHLFHVISYFFIISLSLAFLSIISVDAVLLSLFHYSDSEILTLFQNYHYFLSSIFSETVSWFQYYLHCSRIISIVST